MCVVCGFLSVGREGEPDSRHAAVSRHSEQLLAGPPEVPHVIRQTSGRSIYSKMLPGRPCNSHGEGRRDMANIAERRRMEGHELPSVHSTRSN